MNYKLVYKPFGADAILIEWPPVIDEDILKDIVLFKNSISSSNIKYIVEIKSAYNSLLVIYDAFYRNFENDIIQLKNVYNSRPSKHDFQSRIWHIPVCYDASYGIDLETISIEKKLSKEAIVHLHTSVDYLVYFIGFLPGFLYLGGLDEVLQVPRKLSPRLNVEKGAVAIGGNQTGVYPAQSPGGWNIIGNSPIQFFNPKINPPCFAQAGDRIRFYPISLKGHKDIKTLSDAGVYQLESEVYND